MTSVVTHKDMLVNPVLLRRLLPPVLLSVLPFIIYPRFISNDAFMYTFDSGQSYYVRFHILCDSLQQEKSIPLWQTILSSGSPFHANPENPTLYPPVLLLCALFPPILAMNLTILFHLSVALLGMYFLVLRLWERIAGRQADGMAGALVASALFGLNYYTRLEHFNLPTYGAAHALIPWIFLAADSLLNGASPRRASGMLALLLSLQCFTGGLYVIPYTLLGLVVWFFALGILGGPSARRRTFSFGLLAASLAALIVTAKLLPFLSWVETTNRAEAMDLQTARGVTLVGEEISNLYMRLFYYTCGGIMVLFSIAALPLLSTGIVRTVVMIIVIAALIALGPLYGPLYSLVPPFRHIRCAIRAWTIVNPFLAVTAGLGVNVFFKYLSFHLKRRMFHPIIGPAMVAILLPFLLNSGRFQEFFDHPFSFREILKHYPNWHRIAQTSGKKWRAACLNVRAAGERNEQFIAQALGVETVAGSFGHAWSMAYARHAYPPLSVVPINLRLRRLKILSVLSYVFNRQLKIWYAPLETCEHYTFPRGIDEAYVGRNEGARPRAFIPAAVGAVFGDQERTALYRILDAAPFDVTRASILSLDMEEPPDREVMESLKEIVVVLSMKKKLSPTFLELLKGAKEKGCRITCISFPLNDRDKAALIQVARRLSSPSLGKAEAASFERVSSREVHVRREDPSKGRFLTVSETWPLYGGWVARSGGKEIPIYSADGVAASVFLGPGERSFTARYEPGEVLQGFRLCGIGLLGSLILLLPWPRGRRKRPEDDRR